MRFINRLFKIQGSLERKSVPKSASLNVPVRFNGSGKVIFGENISFGYSLAPKLADGQILIQARYKHSIIEIGDDVEFSNNVSIIALDKIVIGNKCLIANSVSIFDSDFHDISPIARKSLLKRLNSDGTISPTIIEENVWLGSHSLVLKGVKIGADSIIGAGSVVTRNIPSGVMACGVPARVIREID